MVRLLWNLLRKKINVDFNKKQLYVCVSTSHDQVVWLILDRLRNYQKLLMALFGDNFGFFIRLRNYTLSAYTV